MNTFLGHSTRSGCQLHALAVTKIYLLLKAIQIRSPIDVIESRQPRLTLCGHNLTNYGWVLDETLETLPISHLYLCTLSSVWSKSRSLWYISVHSGPTHAEFELS